MKRKNKKMKPFWEDTEAWKKEWKGMPEFIQKDIKPYQTIKVHFRSEEDRIAFSNLLDQNMTSRTKFIWFPKLKKMNLTKRLCIDEEENI